MRSNHNIVQSRKTSLIREFLWIVYKWALVGLCMYFCYQMLHAVNELLPELFICTIITGCFILITHSHRILKKRAEQSNIIDSSTAFFLNLLNFPFYVVLYLYGINRFDFKFGRVLSKPHMLLLAVYIAVPFLYYFLFLD